MANRDRFERCLTPMGTVPISVIYGYSYPVNEVAPKTVSATPKRGEQKIPAWPSSLSQGVGSNKVTGKLW